jgi:MFS family permease
VLDLSPARIGVMMIPLTLSTTFSAYLAGRYVKTSGDYRLPPLLSLPIGIVGLAAMAMLAGRISAEATAMLLMVVGFGVGAIFPVSIVAIQNAVNPREIGTVTGALGYVRSLGGAVFAAAGTALVLALVQHFGVVSGALAGLDDLVRRPLDVAGRQGAADAFSYLFLAIIAPFLAGIALCARVERRALRGAPAPAPAPETRRPPETP